MADVPFIDHTPTSPSGAAAPNRRSLTALLERIERWASLSEQHTQDPEQAEVDRQAAECFWADPRILPSTRP